MLIMDTFNVHQMDEVQEKIKSTNTHLEWIDGRYTWKSQTLDVGVNKPFKCAMRKCYGEFLYRNVEDLNVKVSRLTVAHWVNYVWYSDSIISEEMIRKTWKKIGIHRNKNAKSVLEDVAPIPAIQYTNTFMFGNTPVIAWPEKVEENQDIIGTV